MDEVRRAMARWPIEALFVSRPANVRYLSGFTSPSDGRVLLTPDEVILFTDSRYDVQACEEVHGRVVIWKGRDRWASVRRCLRQAGVRTLGIEQDSMTLGEHEHLTHSLPCKTRHTRGIVEGVREIKTPSELDRIRRAARVNDAAFAHLLGRIRPGVREADLALELEWFLRKRGSFDVAFPVAVASGPNGVRPHAKPTERRIQRGEMVTLDFGATWDGYRSDMTRTVAVGLPSRELRRIYGVVRRAQRTGLGAIRGGVQARLVDQAARDVIVQAGYGSFFGHGLGHGVGLEVHEAPRIGTHSRDRLRPGMVVTCEPGIYVPGVGGVRIEDLVVVTGTGPEVLSLSPKHLIEV